jgi:uncharacterized protein (DUF427 family)
MRAIWKDTTIADSKSTIVVEGNHYFPADSVRPELLQDSSLHTTCPWKGVASYKSVVVNGEVNKDAAWFYPDPKPEAANIRGYYAFWRGVEILP